MINSVLIPEAGGAAAISTIKSLKMAEFSGKTIATDSNPLSAGFFLCDNWVVVPKADQPSFMNKLLDIIKENKVEVLMPSAGFDIFRYSENRKKIEELDCFPVVSDREDLEKCRDKILTYNTLSKNSAIHLPFTTISPDKIKTFPVIAKPRFGKGSKDIFEIHSEADLKYVTSKTNDMIFQEYLPGKEYTIDVLSDLNKDALFAVPRIRIETKGGISTKGKIIRNSEIEEEAMKIAEEIGIRGPCCIQMKESLEGALKLVEINPRMGGGIMFTTLAGANIPKMILDLVEGKKIVIPKISEITVVRYFEETVVKT